MKMDSLRVRLLSAFSLAALFIFFSVSVTHATIRFAFGVADGPGAGIAVLRGWSFDTESGRLISRIELFIGGQSRGIIPCCSARVDVQSAFPQFPATNTLNSGWGTTLNWGSLSEGPHSVRVEITNTLGEVVTTPTRTISVVKLGGFEFVESFELAGATATKLGDEILIEGIIVEDSNTGVRREVDARFAWSTSVQGLVLTRSDTIRTLAQIGGVMDRVWTALLGKLESWLGVRTARAVVAGLQGEFESPAEGQGTGAGITILRGWGVPAIAGRVIKEIRFLVDANLVDVIPCCSARQDVANAFPGNVNALLSGWGTTFNYGDLDEGVHTLRVEIEDTGGAVCVIERVVKVVKPGGFDFIDQFSLANASVSIDGEGLAVEDVQVRDKLSGSEVTDTLRFEWLPNAQALTLVSRGKPELVVFPLGANFGSVPVGSARGTRFVVENGGTGTLEGEVTTTSPYVIADARGALSSLEFSLESGEVLVLTIAFSPPSSGTFSGEATFTSNTGTIIAPLTGTGFFDE